MGELQSFKGHWSRVSRDGERRIYKPVEQSTETFVRDVPIMDLNENGKTIKGQDTYTGEIVLQGHSTSNSGT